MKINTFFKSEEESRLFFFFFFLLFHRWRDFFFYWNETMRFQFWHKRRRLRRRGRTASGNKYGCGDRTEAENKELKKMKWKKWRCVCLCESLRLCAGDKRAPGSFWPRCWAQIKVQKCMDPFLHKQTLQLRKVLHRRQTFVFLKGFSFPYIRANANTLERRLKNSPKISFNISHYHQYLCLTSRH